jgi:TRAP-type transport system periplasmic protein
MKFRRSLLGLLAVAAALGGFSVAAPAQTYKAEYKMSLVLGPPTPWGEAGRIWADLVKERTQGRINIKLYPGVSLIQGDQTREFSALRQGVIDMAVGSTINWSPQVKQLNLFSMPFLMPDYAAVDATSARRSSRPSTSRASFHWHGVRTASAKSPIRRSPSSRPKI